MMTAIDNNQDRNHKIDYFRIWVIFYKPKSVQGIRFIGMIKDKNIPRIMCKDDLIQFIKSNNLYLPDAHNAWLNFDQWMQRRPFWNAETGLPYKISRERIRNSKYLDDRFKRNVY